VATIRLTKEFRFEMAHALLGYDGACSNIHGHSYQLFVTVKGTPVHDGKSPKDGMVVDYSVLKKIVTEQITSQLDHALVLNAATPEEHIKHLQKLYKNIVLFPFQPTCENMLTNFAERIKKVLPTEISLHSVKLCETTTSFAEWFAEDND
jgi:6-pyruvoyltetrahydropterin/6-carboxytetrahydropterin synthase